MDVANELHEMERDGLYDAIRDRFPRVTVRQYQHGERWGIEADCPPQVCTLLADFAAGWRAGCRHVRTVEMG